jgi:hypothetical protein
MPIYQQVPHPEDLAQVCALTYRGQQASGAVAALPGAHDGRTDHGLASLASAP